MNLAAVPAPARLLLWLLAGAWGLGLLLAAAFGDVMAAAVLVAIPLGALGVWVALEACDERPWAVSLIAFAALFMLDATFRIRDYTDKSVDAQIIVKVGTWGLILAIAVANLRRYAHVAFGVVSGPWILLYLWLAVTTSWAVSPLFSLVAVVSMLIWHMFLMYAVTRFSEESIITMFLVVILLFCAISIAVYIAIPSFGRMYEWVGNVRIPRNRMRGISPSANGVGSMAGVGLMLVGLYWRQLPIKRIMIATVVVCGVALVLSQSRTTMLTVAVMLVAYHFGNRRNAPILVLGIGLAVLAVIFIIPYIDQILSLLSRSGRASEITTGTGRAEIWAAVIELWSQRPIQGWGFGSTLFILPTYPGLFGAAAHAHNNALEILISSGMIGLGLLLAALFITLSNAVKLAQWRTLVLLLFVLLRGTTEATPFGGVASSMFLLFTLMIGLTAVARVRERSLAVRPPQRVARYGHLRADPAPG